MACLPDDLRIYAVGDIHGRSDLLARLLALIAEEQSARAPASSRIIFLGDYIDRGPDSHGVVEMLIHGLPAGLKADFLMGNHEQMMLEALAERDALPLWLANGGTAVIEAYGRAAQERGVSADDWSELVEMLPPSHLDFFSGLELYVQYGDYLFVHAGVRPKIAIEHQDPHDLVWIRKPFLNYRGDFGKIVVHGHTPVDSPEIHANRIAIDTGAVFTGRLTALVLEADRKDFLST